MGQMSQPLGGGALEADRASDLLAEAEGAASSASSGKRVGSEEPPRNSTCPQHRSGHRDRTSITSTSEGQSVPVLCMTDDYVSHSSRPGLVSSISQMRTWL